MSDTVLDSHEDKPLAVPNSTVQHPASGQPNRLMSFLADTRAEMRKVITPSRAEVQSTTGVVIATVFIFAAYFWLVDMVLGRGIDKIFSLATRH